MVPSKKVTTVNMRGEGNSAGEKGGERGGGEGKYDNY